MIGEVSDYNFPIITVPGYNLSRSALPFPLSLSVLYCFLLIFVIIICFILYPAGGQDPS